jgi:DNA repair exonuclease SbcCD ATPase subunit
MAKNEKVAATAAKAETSVENVVEQIKAGNKFEVDVKNEAIAQLEKDKKDRQISELKSAINKADYDEKKCLISLRKARAQEKPVKERLKSLDEAIEQLKDGKITPTEYNKKCEEIRDSHRKAIQEIEKEYEEIYRELRNAYPSYWRWDWEL